MKEIRDLTADEIEVRVQSVTKTGSGVILLLYKNARCDMAILDETFGATNWQRHHNRDNANCIVSIYDAEKGEWIEKEDTGIESNTQAEKGLASDSFKRACTNWGIGRELYTSPLIFVTKEQCNITADKKCYDRFSVEKIKIEDKKITALSIINLNKKSRCFVWQAKK